MCLIKELFWHGMLGHQLTLLALKVKEDNGLAFAQGMADSQHTCFLRRVITIVGSFTADEVFNQAGEGVRFKLVVWNKHGAVS